MRTLYLLLTGLPILFVIVALLYFFSIKKKREQSLQAHGFSYQFTITFENRIKAILLFCAMVVVYLYIQLFDILKLSAHGDFKDFILRYVAIYCCFVGIIAYASVTCLFCIYVGNEKVIIYRGFKML